MATTLDVPAQRNGNSHLRWHLRLWSLALAAWIVAIPPTSLMFEKAHPISRLSAVGDAIVWVLAAVVIVVAYLKLLPRDQPVTASRALRMLVTTSVMLSNIVTTFAIGIVGFFAFGKLVIAVTGA